MQYKTGEVTIVLFLFLLPTVSLAATLQEISSSLLGVVNMIARILIGLGLVYFLYGAGSYIAGSGFDDKRKKTAKDTMIYGIIGIFVMVSIWGIIALVRNVLGI